MNCRMNATVPGMMEQLNQHKFQPIVLYKLLALFLLKHFYCDNIMPIINVKFYSKKLTYQQNILPLNIKHFLNQ